MERVYLDTCVWCRLFDALEEEKIKEEFRAVSKVMDAARKRKTVEKLIDEIAGEEIKTSRDTRENL